MASELEDANRPVWLVAEMVCVVCSHPWVSVYPIGAVRLECSNCGHMNDTPEEERQKWNST